MNAERLLALYDRVAEACDAIDRLRRFVLDLAVRGKLVTQDPADDPASELLKRIAAEKAWLVKAGAIKKHKPLANIAPEEGPFELPSSWEWVCLRNILTKLTDGTHHSPPNGPVGDFKYITAKNIKHEGVQLDNVTYVSREVHDEIFARCNPEKGDILYIKDGATTGVVTVNDLDEAFSMLSSVALLKLPSGLFNRLVVEFLRSPFFYDQMRGFMKGAAITRVTLKRMGPALFPLPPLAEQRRIVAKVDELMALCDRLEVARKAREATRDRLTAASVGRLTAPGTDAEAFRTHARFALDTLPALTTRPDQIKPLRQTILDLAVCGKLVEQDIDDEPASELLNAITKTRKRLYSEKKIPKPKSLPQIDEMDLPFDVPAGWEWSMLGQLCYQVADGPHFSPQYVPPERGVPFLSTRNVRPDGFDLSSMKYVSQSDHEEFCKRIKPEPNDIIYTKGGTTGIAKVNDLDFEFSVWVHLAVLRIEKERLFPRYVELALNSPHCYAQSQEYTRGISNFDLGLTRMIKITIPLPPLAEQHRIVAKVDALMALCDRLEASLAGADTTRRSLLEALLQEALNPVRAVLEAAD